MSLQDRLPCQMPIGFLGRFVGGSKAARRRNLGYRLVLDS